MSNQEKYEQALKSEQPFLTLHQLTKAIVDSGASRSTILGELEEFRDFLRTEGRDNDEDIILDLMDCLVGFCSPHVRI